MKTINLIILLLALMPLGLLAQEDNRIVVPFSKPGEAKKVSIQVNRGSVVLTGNAQQKEVIVKYKSRSESKLKLVESNNGLKKIVGGLPNIKIEEHNNTVEIHSQDWNKAVDFTITVPKNVNLEISTHNDGKTEIDNIAGEITVDNHNGPISATKISGTIIANCYNGGIKIDYDKVTPNTPLSYTCYNGDLDISFPSSMKADVRMRTDMGEIFTGFEMNLIQGSANGKKKGSKVYVDGWITGKINGGGPEVVLKNYTGNIYIRKK